MEIIAAILAAIVTYGIAEAIIKNRYRDFIDSRALIEEIVDDIVHLYCSCYKETERQERLGIILFHSDVARIEHTLKRMAECVRWKPYSGLDAIDVINTSPELSHILTTMSINEWSKLTNRDKYGVTNIFTREINHRIKYVIEPLHLISTLRGNS